MKRKLSNVADEGLSSKIREQYCLLINVLIYVNDTNLSGYLWAKFLIQGFASSSFILFYFETVSYKFYLFFFLVDKFLHIQLNQFPTF